MKHKIFRRASTILWMLQCLSSVILTIGLIRMEVHPPFLGIVLIWLVTTFGGFGVAVVYVLDRFVVWRGGKSFFERS